MQTRDIVNAPEVKNTIIERSQKRNDDPEITQWLEKKFFEFVIKQFNPVFHVNSVSAWKICQLPQPIPTWFLKKLEQQPDSQMLYIDPLHEQILALEKPILEFFNSRLKSHLKGKFMKMTYDQVLEAWHKDHEAMKKRLEKGQWDSNENALIETLTVNTGRFVEISAMGQLLRQELAFESRYMQHCLGQFDNLKDLTEGYAEYYVTQKEQGLFRYFSLRDKLNKPHVTISLEWDGENWCIEQIKGKQNEVPVKKYADDVLVFLNVMKPLNNHNLDCEAMGIIYAPEVFETQSNDAELAQENTTVSEFFDEIVNTEKPYFYFYELQDQNKIEDLVIRNRDLLTGLKQQTAALQHILLGMNLADLIRQPASAYIEKIIDYLNTKQDKYNLDLQVEFKQKAQLNPMLAFLVNGYQQFLAMVYKFGQIPLVGWIIKLLVFLLALPWLFVSRKRDIRQQWMLATGDLIYFRNHIPYHKNYQLKSEYFEQHADYFKKHINQILNYNEKKTTHQRKANSILFESIFLYTEL